MKPDWSSSPPWANYASQELSGTWYWHAEQPRYQELTGEWISKGQRQIIPKVTVQAKETLEARPSDWVPHISAGEAISILCQCDRSKRVTLNAFQE